MITSHNPPDIDPANDDSLIGTLNFAFKKNMQNINHMLPAKVIAYDRTANRVQVQLLIMMVTTGGQSVARAQLSSIPVLVLGNQRVFLSFDLQVGDLGWVVANDRDISLFLQSYTNTAPNTPRMFSFSDGLFIPDAMHGYTIDPADTNATVLSTTNGHSRISISSDGITITSDQIIKMTGNFAVTGDITATGNITPHV